MKKIKVLLIIIIVCFFCSPITIFAENKCAYGYIQTGKTCSKITNAYQSNGYYYCPPGSGTLDAVNKKCVSTYLLEDDEDDSNNVVCGSGYVSDGEKCYKILGPAKYRNGVYYCEYENSYLIGTSCVENSIKDVIDNDSGDDDLKQNEKETPVGNCDILNKEILNYIMDALRLIRWVSLALVVILGTLDFVKAAAADDQDSLKKAWKHFVNRLIAVVILFILPLLVDLILRIAGIASNCDWSIY